MQKLNKKIEIILKDFNQGNHFNAINQIKDLLKNNTHNSELLFTYGVMLSKLNYSEKAKNIFEKLLIIKPNHKQSLNYLYISYLKMNKLSESEIIIDKLLKIHPNHYEALRDKAYINYLKQNYTNSEKLIKKAIVLNNKEVFGLNILGLIYIKINKLEEAIKIFEKAILINDKYFDSFNNLGKCYIDKENLNLAFYYFKQAHRINKNSELPIINIGNVLSLKDKYISAIGFYFKALDINPKNNLIYTNIAITYCRLKDFAQATKYYNKAIKVDPEKYNLNLSYAYLLLNKKKFKEAWDLFESRIETEKVKNKNIYHEVIKDKINLDYKIEKNDKILIVKEQGVGDEILFSSIYNDLLKVNKDVKIESDKRLLKIYERSFGKNIFFPYGYFSSSKNKIKNFDKIFYAGSLTKHFRKKIENFQSEPYLISDEKNDQKFKNILKKFKTNKKIGISWKSVVNIYGRLKSLHIDDFRPIFKTDRSIINLQYGNVLHELDEFKKRGFEIYNFKNIDLFNDFDSTLSILKNLDLFVTVSNSTAHIAGALGVPTIIICPKKSSTYYYWDYDDGLTPWYKNVHILKVEFSIKNTINKLNELIEHKT
tara:strand:- start:534 stop:2324 length:1791 start_codon:yes stop_codon:yes gene_type:complete